MKLSYDMLGILDPNYPHVHHIYYSDEHDLYSTGNKNLIYLTRNKKLNQNDIDEIKKMLSMMDDAIILKEQINKEGKRYPKIV